MFLALMMVGCHEGMTDTSAEDIGRDLDPEPCDVFVAWNPADLVITLDAYTSPILAISTTCTDPISVDGLALTFSGNSWLAEMLLVYSDAPGNLAMRNIDGGPAAGALGSYDGVISCDDNNCAKAWDVDLDSYNLVSSKDLDLRMDFVFEHLLPWHEMLDDVPELNDDLDDNFDLAAVITYHAEGQGDETILAETTVTIAAD